MTKKEKQAFIADMCARVPYGVKVYVDEDWNSEDLLYVNPEEEEYGYKSGHVTKHGIKMKTNPIKPYLRKMSTMTDEEKQEYWATLDSQPNGGKTLTAESFDWLNAHHFDYRKWIESDLAIEVTEENNPYAKK